MRQLVAADTLPDLPDRYWIALRPHVGRRADAAVPLPVTATDGRNCRLEANVTDWMTRLPYYAGSEAGEVRLVLAGVRAARR